MDQMKPPVRRFAYQGQIGDRKRVGQQRRKVGIQRGSNLSQRRFVQFTTQCDVKAERIHHVWIAPFDQVGLVHGRQAIPPAFGQFNVRRWCPERIQITDTGSRQCIQRRGFTYGSHGQKPAQTGDLQPVENNRCLTCRKLGAGVLERPNRMSIPQAKRRFHRRMQPVFSRYFGNGGDIQPVNDRDAQPVARIPCPIPAKRSRISPTWSRRVAQNRLRIA